MWVWSHSLSPIQHHVTLAIDWVTGANDEGSCHNYQLNIIEKRIAFAMSSSVGRKDSVLEVSLMKMLTTNTLMKELWLH